MKLSRMIVVVSTVAAVLGPAAPARAVDCKGQSGVNYVWCRVVGGCIASGPEAVDPVICD